MICMCPVSMERNKCCVGCKEQECPHRCTVDKNVNSKCQFTGLTKLDMQINEYEDDSIQPLSDFLSFA